MQITMLDGLKSAAMMKGTGGRTTDTQGLFASILDGKIQSAVQDGNANPEGETPSEAPMIPELSELSDLLEKIIQSEDLPSMEASSLFLESMELLKRLETELPDEQEKDVKEAVNFLVFQINDWLDGARSQSGLQQMKITLQTLQPVIQKILSADLKGSDGLVHSLQPRAFNWTGKNSFHIDKELFPKIGNENQSGKEEAGWQPSNREEGTAANNIPHLPKENEEPAGKPVPLQKAGESPANPPALIKPASINDVVIKLAESSTTESQAKELIRKFASAIQKAHFTQALQSKSLTIRLYPEHLGSLRVELFHRDGAMVARILTSSHTAKDMLDAQIQQLKQAFVQQNIHVEKVDISYHQAAPKPAFSQHDRGNQNQQEKKKDDEEHSGKLEMTDNPFSDQLEKVLFEKEA